MSDMLLSWRFESRSKKGTVFRNWMRSNSGLERFQRPSVSHNNLSAMSFRLDICYQCVETTPASRLNQECSFYEAILEAIEEQFQSKTRRRLGRPLLLNYPDRIAERPTLFKWRVYRFDRGLMPDLYKHLNPLVRHVKVGVWP